MRQCSIQISESNNVLHCGINSYDWLLDVANHVTCFNKSESITRIFLKWAIPGLFFFIFHLFNTVDI